MHTLIGDIKAKATRLWTALDADPETARGMLASVQTWHGFAPVGTVGSGDAAVDLMFAPLKAALPALTRHTHILMAGQSDAFEDGPDGAFWVAGTGYFVGTGAGALFGLPLAGTSVRLRWGEFLRFDAQGRITHAQTIWDLVDLAEQIGAPVLPRPRGASHVFPAPTGLNGVLDAAEAAETEATVQMGRDFIFGGLNSFDQADLSSMGMAHYFHPNLKWYGPGGIGACLSLAEFQELHQQPWLTAFPTRKVLHLESLFAEGPLLAASGPRGVVGDHTGPYLSHPATGAAIEVSGLDFWRRDGDRFTENWVFVDMIHLFAQMGINLLEPFN